MPGRMEAHAEHRARNPTQIFREVLSAHRNDDAPDRILAEMFGGDCDTAAATTLMSTLLCILTIPVLMLLLS